MTDFNQIGLLPAASQAPAPLKSGTVVLYHDDNWGSQNYTLLTSNFIEGQRQSLSGTSIQDAATWIAFNLPVGTIMTLLDNVADQGGDPAWNLRGCGRVVDLIGTGKTESVDLIKCNINDCISSFFWRRLNLQIGAVELFEDGNFSGNRTVIFLDDWNYNTINSIGDWYVSDRASSARWASIDSTVSAALFNNTDGSGSAYRNVSGWGDSKQLASFSDVGFNDVMSSFRWQGLAPKKEIIQPLNVAVSIPTQNTFSLTSQVSGTNKSSMPVPVTVSLTNSDAQTVSVSSTDTFTTGTTITSTVGFSAGMGATGKVTGSLAVAVSFSYTNSSTSTHTDTKSVTLNISQQPSVPANCSYTCTMIVQIGQMPPTTYTTQATRWYDKPVSGSTYDASNGWYKRDENVTLTVSGGLACSVRVDVESTPLS